VTVLAGAGFFPLVFPEVAVTAVVSVCSDLENVALLAASSSLVVLTFELAGTVVAVSIRPVLQPRDAEVQVTTLVPASVLLQEVSVAFGRVEAHADGFVDRLLANEFAGDLTEVCDVVLALGQDVVGIGELLVVESSFSSQADSPHSLLGHHVTAQRATVLVLGACGDAQFFTSVVVTVPDVRLDGSTSVVRTNPVRLVLVGTGHVIILLSSR
jgi:hypothetical protein